MAHQVEGRGEHQDMATLKLNQFIALQKSAKSAGEGAITKAYHAVQRGQALTGIRKTYEPVAEDGQQLPGEGVKLQARVSEVLRGVVAPTVRMLDLTATVDKGNQSAVADVLDPDTGVAILEGVPVSTLLMLEKKVANFAEVIDKIPTLDSSENWTWEPATMSYRTDELVKARTDKVPTNHVKAEATEKHPAQVEILYLDKVVGFWTTVGFSGAISEKTKRELAERVRKLADALKSAREQANMTQVDDFKIGEKIFDYLGWSNIDPQ